MAFQVLLDVDVYFLNYPPYNTMQHYHRIFLSMKELIHSTGNNYKLQRCKVTEDVRHHTCICIPYSYWGWVFIYGFVFCLCCEERHFKVVYWKYVKWLLQSLLWWASWNLIQLQLSKRRLYQQIVTDDEWDPSVNVEVSWTRGVRGNKGREKEYHAARILRFSGKLDSS